METETEDLLQVVERNELQGFQDKKSMVVDLSNIGDLLESFYQAQCPKSSDYDTRRELIRTFSEIARKALGAKGENPPRVELFGSFLMGMFCHKSDLDLSIKMSNTDVECERQAKRKTLKKVARKLYSLQSRGIVRKVQLIFSAAVPVLKVTDCDTGIECDFSIDNNDGVLISQIIFMVSAIDERFQVLCFLMKSWAQAHGINCSREHTLNSLSLISLVALHLQKQDPPILPPFSAILADGTHPALVKKNISKFKNSRQKNGESLAKLFVTLFIRLASVKTLWSRGLCASIYEGSWIYKECNANRKSIFVEDFTDRSKNVARAVNVKSMKKIYYCIDTSLDQIQAFLDRKIELSELRTVLFGTDDHLEEKKDITDLYPCTSEKPILHNTKSMKNTRIDDGLERKESYTPVADGLGRKDSYTLVEGKKSIINPYPCTSEKPILHDAKPMKNTRVDDGLERKESYTPVADGLGRKESYTPVEGKKSIINPYPCTFEKPILHDAKAMKNTRVVDGLERKESYTNGPSQGNAAQAPYVGDGGRKRPHRTFSEAHSADHRMNKVCQTFRRQAVATPSLRYYGGTWGHASPHPVTYRVPQNGPSSSMPSNPLDIRFPLNGLQIQSPASPVPWVSNHNMHNVPSHPIHQPGGAAPVNHHIHNQYLGARNTHTVPSHPILRPGGIAPVNHQNHSQHFGAQAPHLEAHITHNVPSHSVYRPGGAAPFNDQNHDQYLGAHNTHIVPPHPIHQPGGGAPVNHQNDSWHFGAQVPYFGAHTQPGGAAPVNHQNHNQFFGVRNTHIVPCHSTHPPGVVEPANHQNHNQYSGARVPYFGAHDKHNVPLHPIHRPGGAAHFHHQNPW